MAEKDDPYYNIKLGEINYIKGFESAMYWQKALFIDPSNYSLRDYVNFLETGRINTAFNKIKSSGFENNIKDIKDFVFWYKGLLQGAFEIEIDRINLRFSRRTQDNKIKAVYEYISSNIKLKGNGLFSPHKAMDTLYKKRGTVEDKTILALSILSELGIKSYLAFAGQGDFSNSSDFSPGIFTNILLYVPLDVKTGLWMDFSNARYECGFFSDSLAGKEAVVMIKDGYEIKKITVSKE